MSVPIPTLRIGKYKGRKFNQVHPDYLRSLLKFPDLYEETRTQIEYYLRHIPSVARKADASKKDRLEYNPQYFEKTISPPARTKAQKERFREASRQLKEKMGWV
jgi:hypothetical protein